MGGRHLCNELEEKVVRSLREEVSSFSDVHVHMLERSNMKVRTSINSTFRIKQSKIIVVIRTTAYSFVAP